MTVFDAASALGFEIACECENSTREITKVYCCDLLSLVMGRAPADCAWVTVMGNVNAVAVSVLADVSCMVIAEGMPLDGAAAKKAKEHGLTVLRTSLPVFDAADKINSLLKQQ